MSRAVKCDACERFLNAEDAVKLRLSVVTEIAADDSESLDEWPAVDICRECLQKSAGELLEQACVGFDAATETEAGF